MSEIPEHGREPVPGLPERLPPGERILWQGAPNWKRFAIRALHARKLAIYFSALLLIRIVQQPADATLLGFVAIAAVCMGLVLLLALLMSRSALYTITNRRIVLRFGIALPMSINLPFKAVDSVDMRLRGQRDGDIAIRPTMNRKFSYVVMWPHVRPWRFSPLEPMMRCLDDARDAAEILIDAIAASEGRQQLEIRTVRQDGRNDESSDKDTSMGHERPFPLPPLLGAAALIGITVASVAWMQFAAEPNVTEPALEPVQSIKLQFEDRADGSVAVLNADNGDLIDVLAPGTNNFLRATLRGLVRGRNAIGDLSGRPFLLQQIADGRLLLVDPVTRHHVDLWAFGQTNALSFQRFLRDGMAESAVEQVDIDDISASIELTQTKENLP